MSSEQRASETLSVVLAGGGCKTFWGMGVLRGLGEQLPPVSHWAGASAGAAMCLVRTSGREDECYDYFLDITGSNARNFYPRHLLRGQPLFPHDALIRKIIRFTLADGGFNRIRSGPPVHILMSYLAPGRPLWRTTLPAVWNFERRSRLGHVHGPSKPFPGIHSRVVRSTDAMDPGQLLDWVRMSGTVPPVTPLLHRGGRRYLDGALVDNVPVRALPKQALRGRILVMLSSPYSVARRWLRLPEGGRILYLAPTDELPVHPWDYTSPEAIAATYELGQREARVLWPRVEQLLT